MSATMDNAQKQLFGRFPRAVGSPDQHIVHSPGEFDVFCETVQAHRNAYSTLSWFPLNGGVVCDKVSFDFDSPGKETAFEDGLRDDEKIDLMREDADVREEVLGEVCEEVRVLTEYALERDTPVMGVFSGFGIHVHFLYEDELSPAEKMGSTARYLREELELVHLDPKPIGDEQRIMRVPNMKRVHHDSDYPPYEVHIPCDLWTIPLRGAEMAEITPEELMDLSREPRPSVTVEADSRPEMPMYEDYTKEEAAVTSRPDRPSVEGEISEEGIDWYVKELLQMPCMTHNILLDKEPPHEIRLNSAVLLFNIGLTPDEVLDIFAAIGWSDWSREVTRKQLRHIYKKKYSDMSCKTLMEEGFCVHEDDPHECPTYGWSGGEPEW